MPPAPEPIPFVHAVHCYERWRVGIERKNSGQCDYGAGMFEYIQIKSILILRSNDSKFFRRSFQKMRACLWSTRFERSYFAAMSRGGAARPLIRSLMSVSVPRLVSIAFA